MRPVVRLGPQIPIRPVRPDPASGVPPAPRGRRRGGPASRPLISTLKCASSSFSAGFEPGLELRSQVGDRFDLSRGQ